VRYRIRHTSRYTYGEMVPFSAHRFFLRPREDHHLRLERFDLHLMPQGRLRWARDLHENFYATATPEGESKQLAVVMEAEVDLRQDNPFDFLLDPHAVDLPLPYLPREAAALAPYLGRDTGADGAAVAAWMDREFPGGLRGGTVEALTRLNQAVHRVLRYTRREESGVQSPARTLENQSGSCRDFAVLMIEACRAAGLAARFVSGYLHTAEGDGPSRADNAMHAWAEVYLPGAGWKGVDPTHGILCGDGFIPVAVALDPATVSPIQGSYVCPHPVANELEARVEVTRLE
jgi:transglutaminase-like putative cysteine protease